MPIRASRTAGLVVAASLLAGLTACAEQPRPSPPPSIPPEDAVTTTASPPSAPAMTPKGGAKPSAGASESEYERDADGYPVMPALAKQDTKAGAEAFARWYLELISVSATNPKPGVVAKHALPDCKTCNNVEAMNKQTHAAQTRMDQDQWVVGKVRNTWPSGQGWSVAVPIRQLPVREVDRHGKVLRSAGADSFVLYVKLVRRGDAWRVQGIPVEAKGA